MRDVTICYGMTETSPVSTQTRLDAPIERRVGSVGTVHPHLEVKIIDPATGQTGNSCIFLASFCFFPTLGTDGW
jgi:long-subunit acyl-CoA synthetase (AMP-forming)